MRISGYTRRVALCAWPLLALSCLAIPAATAGDGVTANLLASPGTAIPSVVADFDGDHKLDFATFGTLDPARRGKNDPKEIQVHFAATPFPAFSFSVLGAANRLRARDLDGDHDRDLVLETASRIPLAVWINDGEGNFHRGNLNNFRFQLSHDDPRSLGSSDHLLPAGRPAECPTRYVAFSNPFLSLPQPVGARVASTHPEHLAASRNLSNWTRGPPRFV